MIPTGLPDLPKPFRAQNSRRKPEFLEVKILDENSNFSRVFAGERNDFEELRTSLGLELSELSVPCCLAPCLPGFMAAWPRLMEACVHVYDRRLGLLKKIAPNDY